MMTTAGVSNVGVEQDSADITSKLFLDPSPL